MTDLPDFSSTAAVLADTTRAHMLTQLLSGMAFTAGELAVKAGVSPQTASNHLNQLLTAGFITAQAQGRYRYFQLANREVAELLEAMLYFENQKSSCYIPKTPSKLRFARCCYDHLAGELSVLLFDAFLQQDLFKERMNELALTISGENWLSSIGIDIEQLAHKRRPLLRTCLDWSERKSHLAGAVGAALLDRFLVLHWCIRGEGREVYLTSLGQQQLELRLSLKLQAIIKAQQNYQ